MKKTIILMLYPLFITTPVLAQQNCTQAMQTLKNHQSLMRKGYSASTGEKLRAKERKLFNAYQKCLNSPPTHSGTKTKQKKASNNVDYSSAPQIKWQNTSLNFRGRFSGEKQKAWLAYYKQPEQCSKPKSLQDFAWCTEHKTKSSEVFSELWHSK